MTRLLLHWILSALCLLAVAHLVPGFVVKSFGAALVAALVIGLVNGTLGLLLKVLTFPLTVITLGLFLLVINAIMLKIAAVLAPGFEVIGFLPALVGALILSVLHLIVRRIVQESTAG